MKRTISLMLLLAFVAVFAVGCGASPEKKLEKAKAAAADGNFEKALELVKEVVADEKATAEVKKEAEKLVAEYTAKLGTENLPNPLD